MPAMPNPPIRILLADDHKLTSDSWSMLLGYDLRFSVIHVSENGLDAIEKASLLLPDIVLVDINMYPVNGFEVAEKILQQHPDIKIIGISVNNHPSYAKKMLKAGAKGFITKSSSFEEITRAIVEVQEGQEFICSEIKNMQL